jgi:16S rRNA (adenine1518-N6/adenine1519-N6)-dimethyltransferase
VKLVNTSPTAPPRPKKRLGQHFLRDQEVIQRIIQVIDPKPGQRLVEIGPGPGAITWPLLETLGELDVIELDRELAKGLQTRGVDLPGLRVHVIDALCFDFQAFQNQGQKLRVVGNLPYNISSPLLFHLLDQVDSIDDMVFMLQKEVAERITALPGSKQYGRLSVMIQYRCMPEIQLRVSPQAFHPPPQVESAVIRLIPKPGRDDPATEEIFRHVVKQAFSQRRKTLRNALKGILGADILVNADIDPARRPETLSVEDYLILARQLANASNSVI